jgi:hypothetical protein
MTEVSVARTLVLPYQIISLIHKLTKRLHFLYRVKKLEVETDRIQ